MLQLLRLYEQVMEDTGGAVGISNLDLIESALAQPHSNFNNKDLYPDIVSKAAVLGYSLISNHGFVDGNKRIGHAAMEVFLVINGWELFAEVAEQEKVVLDVAAGVVNRSDFENWVRSKAQKSQNAGQEEAETQTG